MFGMGVLPSKVWHQQKLVHDESNNIIPSLGWRKGTMSTLVGYNPWTGHDGTHPKGVKRPSRNPFGDLQRIIEGWKVSRQDLTSGIGKRNGHNGITDQVGHSPDIRPLEAVLWDNSFNLTLRWKLWCILVQGIVR